MDTVNASSDSTRESYLSSIRVRGACRTDYKEIERLYKKDNFNIDFRHLERLMVVEDANGIIAVGCLATLLEASFVTDETRSQRQRVLALTALLQQVDKEVKTLAYDNFHVYITNESMMTILKGKFNFVKTAAKQVLLRWINND